MASQSIAAVDPDATAVSGATPAAAGLVSFLVQDVQRAPAPYITVLVVILVALLLSRVAPAVDPREPKVLKPTIPIIGHIIGLIRLQNDFLPRLRKSTDAPIVTLPMLNGKMYSVFDPLLIQAALRNENLSLAPFAIEMTKKLQNIDDSSVELIKTTNILDAALDAGHKALTGDHLQRMNGNALRWMAELVNTDMTGGGWHEIPNFWIWTRDTLTGATCEALYGPTNPFRETAACDDLWEYEENLLSFVMGVFPRWTAPRAWAARERLHRRLDAYYAARGHEHPQASELIRKRYETIRAHGWPDHEVGRSESALSHAATANTIPALFWFACNVFSRPELVLAVRAELERVVEFEHGGKKKRAVIDISRLENECPLLGSCYRETLRTTNVVTTMRRVVKDTTLSDGRGGSFLLKEGVNVQFAAGSSHTMERVWGDDALTFRPDRFVDAARAKGSAAEEKLRRAAFHPFGGGKNLCPGRNFALVENLAFIATLVLGFDVEPLGGGAEWVLPQKVRAGAHQAIAKPVRNGEGFGVRMRRRAGWEETEWAYKCTSEAQGVA